MAMRSGGADDLNAEINVTPLVDVMLVLLIIFMITAPMMNTGVDIELPQVNATQIKDPEGKAVLSIQLNHKVQLTWPPDPGTVIPWKDLEVKLKTNLKLQKRSELYIEADAKLPYGVVVTAMAIARNAGISKVMMLTDPSETIAVEELDKTATR